MRIFLRWAVRIVAALVTLVIVAIAALYVISNSRLHRVWNVTPEPVAIPTDSASVAWGKHIAAIHGCAGCHTANLGGEVFIDAPPMARLYARNLTPGRGGIGKAFTDADWVRAIRHGVKPDGHALLFMPSQEFYSLSDRDLGSLIAYLKTLPPVDTTWPDNSVGPVGRALYLSGQVPLVPAELINHAAPRPVAPPMGETVEYGKYLAMACVGCHGEHFSGGLVPGAPPGMLPARNLTPDSTTGIGMWSLKDFRIAIQYGQLPNGAMLDSLAMPIPITRQFNDTESAALYAFFMSLPPRPYGTR